MGMSAFHSTPGSRRPARIPMEVAVVLEGHTELPGEERTFTENVSAHGARIFSVRHWAPNDRLTVLAPAGKFRSKARVAYCQSLRGEGYAIGVEFLDPAGRWVVQS